MRASLKRNLVLLIRSFCIFCCFCGCPVVIFMTFHIILLFGSLWLPLKWILWFSSPAGQNMSLLFSPSSVLFAIKLSRFVKYMSQANARTAALCVRLLKCAAQRERGGEWMEREGVSLSLYVSVGVCGAAIKCYLSLLHVAQCHRAGAAIWLNALAAKRTAEITVGKQSLRACFDYIMYLGR